jgi:hypothetical protein
MTTPHDATDAFLSFAESRIKPGQRVHASRLLAMAVRWCAETQGCAPLKGRGLAAALRARGWTSRRLARGVEWSFGQSGSAM